MAKYKPNDNIFVIKPHFDPKIEKAEILSLHNDKFEVEYCWSRGDYRYQVKYSNGITHSYINENFIRPNFAEALNKLGELNQN